MVRSSPFARALRSVRKMPRVAVAAGILAGVAILGLLIAALLSGDWTSLLMGIAGGACVALLLTAIHGQRSQLAMSRELAARVDKELAVRLRQLEAAVARVETRPRLLESSPDEQVAENAARFDWLARVQAEILSVLKARQDASENRA